MLGRSPIKRSQGPDMIIAVHRFAKPQIKQTNMRQTRGKLPNKDGCLMYCKACFKKYDMLPLKSMKT